MSNHPIRFVHHAGFWTATLLLALLATGAWADTVESNLFSLDTRHYTPLGGDTQKGGRLAACFPNPFNPTTTIHFALDQDAEVELMVYDLTGRRVRTLLAGQTVTAGPHEAVWRGVDDQGRAAAAGVYLCRLRVGKKTDSLRMTLIK